MEGEASKIGGNLPMAVEIRFGANDIYDQLGWAILLQFYHRISDKDGQRPYSDNGHQHTF